MLGSKSGMSANSADPEHSNINPNVEMTDYASQNKKLLQYDQTELMLGSEENDGNHELSGNESETQLSKNCTINSNRNVVQNNDVTVRSSPTDLIQPRQNESETKGIPNNTSGGAECLSNREQEEKLGSKEADRGEESVDRRKEEILTPVYQPASALDHTGKKFIIYHIVFCQLIKLPTYCHYYLPPHYTEMLSFSYVYSRTSIIHSS